MGPRKIIKPWGYEEWLELNDRYCLKRLVIDIGHRLSLQYHDVKIETIVVVSGILTLTLETMGLLVVNNLQPGEYVTVIPGTIHRFAAHSGQVVLLEASTPEVDDITRLDDDYGRSGSVNDNQDGGVG